MLRRIKKSFLQSPIVLVGAFQTRLEERPFSVTLLSPETYSLDGVQKIALGLLIAPAGLCFLTSPFSAQWALFLLLDLFFC